MIVASFARTGATRYCMDLAEREGCTFLGELAPTYLGNVGGGKAGIKAAIHETGFQPTLTVEQFMRGINPGSRQIFLVNKSAYLIADTAAVIVLREDVHAAMMSCCNIISRLGTVDTDVVIFYAMLMYEEAYGLATFCHATKHSDCPRIVWFEDLYPDHEQKLDALKFPDYCKTEISAWLRRSDIDAKMHALRSRK